MTQQEMTPCPYCQKLYVRKRIYQEFCSGKCRTGYHTDFGAHGKVAGVTRLKHGRVSVVTHFEAGPAAEHAIALKRGEKVRAVRVDR